MRGLVPARELAAVLTGRDPVELDAEGDEVAHALRTLTAQHVDSDRVAQSRTRHDRVGGVRGGAVVGEERRGDAALGVPGVGFGELGLGHEHDLVVPARTVGGHEAGDAGSDDDDAGHQEAGLAASIRSRATRASAATSASTLIRLSTSPRTSASSTHAR